MKALIIRGASGSGKSTIVRGLLGPSPIVVGAWTVAKDCAAIGVYDAGRYEGSDMLAHGDRIFLRALDNAPARPLVVFEGVSIGSRQTEWIRDRYTSRNVIEVTLVISPVVAHRRRSERARRLGIEDNADLRWCERSCRNALSAAGANKLNVDRMTAQAVLEAVKGILA